MKAPRASFAIVAPLAVVVSSCALGEPTAIERTSAVSSPIVNGIDSDASQDAIVLVMHYDAMKKGGGAASGCTGTLLTPLLVLTARHCVALTDSGAACDSEGRPVVGGAVDADHQPSAIYVFAGKDRPDFLAGTARPARGQEILTTGAETLCDNDIALVLLDRPIAGAKIAPLRLDAKPEKGEEVTVVGWGIADDDPNPATRRQRTDVTILDVGPADELGPKEFRVGEGTCQGDSGGPAIAASGAVLGALSRGGNGARGKGADACLGGTNIFTQVAAHADFIRAGYEKAGQEPWLEGQPSPLLAVTGAACGADAECRSGACDAERGTCAEVCDDGSACHDGFACVAEGDRKLCAPSSPPAAYEGCSAVRSPSGGSRAGGALLALALVVASARRARGTGRARPGT